MNINKIIDLHRYAYKDKSLLKIVALFCYSCLLLLFKKYKISENTNFYKQDNNKYLFYKSMHRVDYDKLFDSIVDVCDASKIIIKSSIVYGFDFSFLKNAGKDLEYFKQIDASSIIERLYLFCSYLFYKKMLNKIEKYEFDYLVVFADMQPVENLIVQYFNEQNKKTVTLQHGLFLEHGWNSNLNEINYTNIVSQYFLTWGKENKKFIEKYNKNVNIVICGNPTIELVEKNFNETKVKFFTVVFDSNLWRDYNQRMLDIATCVSKETGYKINIRFHPANKPQDYHIDKKYTINDTSLNYYNSQFILGHTSSMIHVCMRQGLIVFKMVSDMPHSYINPKFYFSNCKNILDKIEHLTDYKEVDLNHIAYVAKESLIEYKLFFNDILIKSINKNS